jgi:hypothetical protein
LLKGTFLVKIPKLEEKAEEALRKCLEGIPFLKIQKIRREAENGNPRPDLVVDLLSPQGIRQKLIVEIKNNGQPRQAREAVNQILRYREDFPSAYGVFLAPYVSQTAAEICAEAGIGYVDLSGNCRLHFGQVYVEREGNPNKFAQKRDLRSLYSPKATRVLRVLLTNPKKVWKVAELAKESGVSLGQASNVKKLLADREWLRTQLEGIVLANPEGLLVEWAENYSFRQNRVKDYYSLKSPAEIEVELAELCGREGIRYALTGFSGAARMAPVVQYQRVFAYIDGDLVNVASLLNLKEVASGANVTLLSAYDEGIFYGARAVEGVWTASPIQIYLDLMSFRGRGEEAAHALLDEVIRKQW